MRWSHTFNKHIRMLVNICNDKHFPIHREAYGFAYTQVATKVVRSCEIYQCALWAKCGDVLNLQRSRNRLYNILLIIVFTKNNLLDADDIVPMLQ